LREREKHDLVEPAAAGVAFNGPDKRRPHAAAARSAFDVDRQIGNVTVGATV
jgi:hypothetical protein